MRPARLAFVAPLAVALATSVAVPRSAHAGVAPPQATPVQREQAQSRFLKGKELYAAGKHEAALEEFAASLDIVSSPNTRLYVARCYRELGRLVPAYVEFGRTAVEAREMSPHDPRYDRTAKAALEERAQLEPKLGFVDVVVAHPGETTTLKVAGDEVRRGGWNESIPVLPGTAEVLAETPGRPPVRESVQVAAGQHRSVEIDAKADRPALADAPATAEPSTSARPPAHAEQGAPLRTYAVVLGGVAVAGLATFAIGGAMANATYSDLQKACGSGPCPPGHEDEIASGRTKQTIANVGLAVGSLAAAAGVTLWIVGTPKAQGAGAAASAPARVVARPSFVTIEGAF